jgi:hypothetical protein
MPRLKSSLERFQGVSPLSDEELERKRARAYHEQDIYIFTPEQRHTFTMMERMMLEAFAIRIYGRRK